MHGRHGCEMFPEEGAGQLLPAALPRSSFRNYKRDLEMQDLVEKAKAKWEQDQLNLAVAQS